ncbi:uncharacterized protein L969DRAFT_69121 [Mixia osmundae IAM 14324]|uniref:Phosphatidylethanolamine-binding protein n=1 Tax=Mixia osmundae (strain CBS 9802 / IAM 14324 / JCM 22182 / KY 12970) TaxID=764103 RepID=G7E086_MIXOS|nr:uncharacterized protein L969DRAFT_69121 [Mixia osmundae IAM 14324]KEI42236.1 hypothetical protein L969DRAFT_69121 [Mixia osmundae IAM 14324]GAA96246.1 hypothetical protein E5Q_02910 [Mixia osmundae IAM 14324]
MPLLGVSSVSNETLKQAGILDTLGISSDFKPSVPLIIRYGDKFVQAGTKLKPSETQREPELQFAPIDKDAGESETMYTIILTDPDDPSREDPRDAQYRHWLQQDIKPPSIEALTSSNDDSIRLQMSSTALTPYEGPYPPAKTSYHRYCFLLFAQPSTVAWSANEFDNAQEARGHWNAIQWADAKGLRLVGADYFLCQDDEQ